jgi:hypothetical protein
MKQRLPSSSDSSGATMTRRFHSVRHIFFLTAIVALAAAASAPAQPASPRSHVPIPAGGTDLDIVKEFESQHLSLASALAAQEFTRKLMESPEAYGLKREDLEALRQRFLGQGGQLNLDMRDPKWQELMRKALETRQQQSTPLPDNLSPTDFEGIEKLLAKLAKKDSTPANMDGPPSVGGTAAAVPASEMPVPPAPAPPAEPMTLPIDPAKRSAEHPEMTRKVMDLAEKFQDRFPAMRDSEAMKRTMRALADAGRRSGDGAKSDWREGLPQWLRDVRWDRLRKNVENSRLANFSLPRWRSSNSNAAPRQWAMNVPHVAGAAQAPSSGADIWSILLWVGAALAAGVALWKLVKEHRKWSDAAAAGWRLGPWPVPPGAVRTRAELVRAFEHLALLCLGPPARHWNHLEIALRLTQNSTHPPYVGRVASNLAGLYERARYAPLDEPLPDSDLAIARRELCFLAGVPAA